MQLRDYRSSKARHPQIITYSCGLILSLFFWSIFSGSLAQAPKTGDALTVSEVRARVQKAVGYEKLKGLKRGFVVEETRTTPDSTGRVVRMYGKAGEVRQWTKAQNSNPFLFDGKDVWIINSSTSSARHGSPTTVSQRTREKLILPWWIQSGWWLNESAPLEVSLLPAESNQALLALSIRLKGGVVGSKLFINRETWLPATYVVEYEKGPYTLKLDDYRQALGFRYPHQFLINYNGSDTRYKIESIRELPEASAHLFRRLPESNRATFDNILPAHLKIARGTPNPDGTKGHAFVRPLIDGKDVGWFNFDTGADNMMIDARLADELRMPVLGEAEAVAADGRVRKVTIRRGKTFRLGRVTIEDPIFVADDLSRMSAPPGEKRAGFCGYPLFANVIIEFTGGGEEIALYDPSSYRLRRGRWQHLSLINYRPTVSARLEGDREALFMLDTGSVTGVSFNHGFTKEQRLLEARRVTQEESSSSGGTFKLLRGSIRWFELAGYQFKNPSVSFRIDGDGEAQDVAGVIGREFMAPFTIVFNYPERTVAFIR